MLAGHRHREAAVRDTGLGRRNILEQNRVSMKKEGGVYCWHS
jgi:hypothetical protein